MTLVNTGDGEVVETADLTIEQLRELERFYREVLDDPNYARWYWPTPRAEYQRELGEVRDQIHWNERNLPMVKKTQQRVALTVVHEWDETPGHFNDEYDVYVLAGPLGARNTEELGRLKLSSVEHEVSRLEHEAEFIKRTVMQHFDNLVEGL